MTRYPVATDNPNVPTNAFIVCETNWADVIITTYYLTPGYHARMTTNTPAAWAYPVGMSDLNRMTGDTEEQIYRRWETHQRILAGGRC